MKKISFILPVYNVGSYVQKCVESLLNQNVSHSDYEIILVNDGSTDNSLEVIKQIEEDNINVSVVNTINGGASSARNIGLKMAKGDYVWFIDADDWIEINCLDQILGYLNDVEILAMDSYFSDDKNDKILAHKRNLVDGSCYTGEQVYKSGYIYPYSGVPFYIFRRDFLLKNNLFFKEGIYHEDLLITPCTLALSTKVKYYSKPCYHYYIRPNSVTTSKVTKKFCEDILFVADELYLFSNNNYIIYDSISKMISGFYNKIIDIENKKTKKELRNLFFTRKFWLKSILISGNYRYVIYYLLIKLNLLFRKM